jgi:hypothetical protein
MRENIMECSDLVAKMDLFRQKCINAEAKAESGSCYENASGNLICPPSYILYDQYLDYKSELKHLEYKFRLLVNNNLNSI